MAIVGLAAVLSGAELMAGKMFSGIILPHTPQTDAQVFRSSIIFLGIFGSLRAINYFRETYRITVFEKSLARIVKSTPQQDSWRWATAMEVTSILTMISRLVVISFVMALLSPTFALANLVVSAIIAQAFSILLRKQFIEQREFRKKQKSREIVPNVQKVRTRIRAAELATLLSAFGVMGLMGLLVALTVSDRVSPQNAVVLFIAVRMMGQMYSGVASGLMRYVRATVFSE